jgi:hypothetical protein
MTAFAATFVSDRLVAEAASGDELALDVLKGIVRVVEAYEAHTDAELAGWIKSHRESYSYFVSERDYSEASSHEYEESVIQAVLAERRAVAAKAVHEMTDTELSAALGALQVRFNEAMELEDPSEVEVSDFPWFYDRVADIRAAMRQRAAVARHSVEGDHLTHRPFAGLVLA